MKKLLMLPVIFVLASCATGYSPEYRYSQVRVLNNSDQMIKNLVIQDQNSQRTLECGDLNGYGFCQHPIPKLRYKSMPLDVSWMTEDGTNRTESVEPAIKGPYTQGSPIQVELNFAEDGSLSGVLKQEALSVR